jgi:hypothetical protein
MHGRPATICKAQALSHLPSAGSTKENVGECCTQVVTCRDGCQSRASKLCSQSDLQTPAMAFVVLCTTEHDRVILAISPCASLSQAISPLHPTKGLS